jgi:cell division protein YceG involved in septum cleavage
MAGHRKERTSRQERRKVNKMVTAVIGVSIRIIVITLLVMLFYTGITKGFSFGYDIFAGTAVGKAPGRDITIVVKEGESSATVGKRLEAAGLIEDSSIFLVQQIFYDYKIYPGEYTLNTSMTSKEMLIKMNVKPETEKASEEETSPSREEETSGETSE